MSVYVLVCVTVFIAALGGLTVWRQRRYFHYITNERKRYQVVQFANDLGESVTVQCDANGFAFPQLETIGGALFIELTLRASIIGWIFDPAIEIEAPGFRDVQVFERGIRGVRFINLTRLWQTGVSAGQIIRLRGRHVSWKADCARVEACTEQLGPKDRLLVLAPHPDDAEIAAFGLYSSTDATVVILSAGNETNRFAVGQDLNIVLSRAQLARLRVLDSITAPQIGGLSPEQTVNLCYPDGRFAAMYAQPESDFAAEDPATGFLELRRLNPSSLVRSRQTLSWKTLIDDLVELLLQIKPTVIVAPHPWLDLHPDHVFTTVAICEALHRVENIDGRFYFYANHSRFSELWPFGPAGAGVPMLPVATDDLFGCDSIYSHSLSPELQSAKFVAIESMHDIRDIGLPEPEPFLARWKAIRRQCAAAISGLGSPPTTFLRRAVRPDELFLSAPYSRGCQLNKRVLQRGTPS